MMMNYEDADNHHLNKSDKFAKLQPLMQKISATFLAQCPLAGISGNMVVNNLYAVNK